MPAEKEESRKAGVQKEGNVRRQRDKVGRNAH